MDFKYIMVRNTHGTLTVHTPIIFPEKLIHADMWGVMRLLFKTGDPHVRSAGRVSFKEGIVVCYDKSDTLGLVSHKDDAHIIQSYNYTAGIET